MGVKREHWSGMGKHAGDRQALAHHNKNQLIYIKQFSFSIQHWKKKVNYKQQSHVTFSVLSWAVPLGSSF